MPPVVLAALLAFHCSEHVWMRARNGFSLENFGSTAEGNTALPTSTGAAGSAAGFRVRAGLVSATGGGAAGAAAGAAAASALHSALRKSFHFWPLRVPAALASLYFALHSDMLNACAGMAANAAKPDTATAHNNFARMVILVSLGRGELRTPILAQ